ncbi:hypothetical protein KFL_006070050 [Klebsormidium nitens]|uniref:Uncharacterized protein n=1 Tax=Klebsormidium nitens TaxID=105231 RepID=A0A1Y1IHK4_KLENI|nr:hypothetical protein KFL_006070050 [Klebsormidium nitens]|eukprot:GAQ90163.1 hypothetical protein KFL_006070050 [Klebsormidium nitens]
MILGASIVQRKNFARWNATAKNKVALLKKGDWVLMKRPGTIRGHRLRCEGPYAFLGWLPGLKNKKAVLQDHLGQKWFRNAHELCRYFPRIQFVREYLEEVRAVDGVRPMPNLLIARSKRPYRRGMSEEGLERKKRQQRAEERSHRKRGPPETSESTESEEIPLVRPKSLRKERSEATAEEQDAAMGKLDEADLHRPLDVLHAPHQPDLRFEELQAPLLEVISANPRTEPKQLTEIDGAQALVASHNAIAGKVCTQLLANWIFVIGHCLKHVRVKCYLRGQPLIQFLIGILRRIVLSEAFNLLSGPHAVEEKAYLMGIAEWARHERSDPAGKDIDFFVGQWSSKIAKRPRLAQSFGQWQYGVSAVLTGGRVEQELAAIARDTALWLEKPLTFPPFLRSELRNVKAREIQVLAKAHKTWESVLVLADRELASAACPFPRKGLKSEGEQTVEGAQSAGRTDSQAPSFVDVVRRRESSGGGRGGGARAPTPKKQKTGVTAGAQGGEAESARARRRQSRGEKSREEPGEEMEGAGQGPTATVTTEEPAEENESNMLRAWEVAKTSAEDEWLRRARADKVKRFGSRSDRGGKFVEEMRKDGVWCKIQLLEGTEGKWESAGIEFPQLQLKVHGFLRNILWGEPVGERFALFMPDEFFLQYVDGTTVSDLGLVELEQLALDASLQEWERSANRGVLFQWGMLNDPQQLYGPRTVPLSAFQCSSRDEDLDSAFKEVDLTIPAAVIEQIVFDRRKEPRWTKDRVRDLLTNEEWGVPAWSNLSEGDRKDNDRAAQRLLAALGESDKRQSRKQQEKEKKKKDLAGISSEEEIQLIGETRRFAGEDYEQKGSVREKVTATVVTAGADIPKEGRKKPEPEPKGTGTKKGKLRKSDPEAERGRLGLKTSPPGSATLEEAQLKSPRTPSKSPAKPLGERNGKRRNRKPRFPAERRDSTRRVPGERKSKRVRSLMRVPGPRALRPKWL